VSTAVAVRPFAGLWNLGPELLAPLGLRELDVPGEFAHAEGSGGRMRLRAAAWEVGPTAAPIAECRSVLIQGEATDIVNTWIYPHRPDELPTFAAELLAFGHRPRLAFVDLQVPGLSPAGRSRTAAVTHPLAARFAGWRCPEEPPGWAVESSSGGHLFARPGDPAAFADLTRAFEEYLVAWSDLATTARAAGIGDELSREALARFKRHHATASPGRPFLAKLFGQEWTDRFLDEFLYA
jgi:hypothetical protein